MNVFVSDKVITDNSTFKGGYAVSWVNQNQSDLPHEIAHQFMGDTRNALLNRLGQDKLTGSAIDFYHDMKNDMLRDALDLTVTGPGPTFGALPRPIQIGPLPGTSSIFNQGARAFQQAITPTTK